MRPAGVAQLGGGIAPEATGVAVLVLHNLAVHRVLPSPANAVLNLVTAAPCSAWPSGDTHRLPQWHGPRCSSAPRTPSRP